MGISFKEFQYISYINVHNKPMNKVKFLYFITEEIDA